MYGINTNGTGYAQLGGIPKNLVCDSPVSPNPPSQIIIRTGYVDKIDVTSHSSNFSDEDFTYIEGWAFQSNAQPTCVMITYVSTRTTVNTEPQQFTQEVCPSINRPDAERWLRQNHGNNLNISQPLGFVAYPARVITVPGTYRIQSVVLSQSTGTSLELAEAARGTFGISGVNKSTVSIVANGSLTAMVGQPYSVSFSISIDHLLARSNIYDITVAAGSRMPPGLAFHRIIPDCAAPVPPNPATCAPTTYAISGTPTQGGGFFTFSLQASNSAGIAATVPFTIVVNPFDTSNLMVTSPAAGETWRTGETHTIAWAGDGLLA